ncbi:VOC family protein, partial [Emcibacteraceae bacterium]|nr:VOC family protein [Emcibacteraceae bacterium]
TRKNGDTEGRIKMATVSAPDIDATLKSYQDHFAYKVIEESIVTETQANSWGTPKMVGRRQIITGPESGAEVYIRLVQNDDVPKYEYLRSYGWNAIEITVTDADLLHAKLKNSPFKIIGEPTEYDFSDAIYPMQAVGLSKELFYLNQIRGDLPAYDLPGAKSFVDHIFIMILATPDVKKTIQFYVNTFGWEEGKTFHIPYSVINNAFDLPEDTKHFLSMSCNGRVVNNEIDQYPEGTIIRPRNDDMLEPGIAMTTYMVEDLDKIKAPLLTEPAVLENAGYDGRRSACCIGSAGELIELIEI